MVAALIVLLPCVAGACSGPYRKGVVLMISWGRSVSLGQFVMFVFALLCLFAEWATGAVEK